MPQSGRKHQYLCRKSCQLRFPICSSSQCHSFQCRWTLYVINVFCFHHANMTAWHLYADRHESGTEHVRPIKLRLSLFAIALWFAKLTSFYICPYDCFRNSSICLSIWPSPTVPFSAATAWPFDRFFSCIINMQWVSNKTVGFGQSNLRRKLASWTAFFSLCQSGFILPAAYFTNKSTSSPVVMQSHSSGPTL